jgi:26S proteasome regulatory subunit T4
MDGFDTLGKVKIIMATNRPDTLDPALMRPGRLDRKIGMNIRFRFIIKISCFVVVLEIPLPNEQARLDILKIHAAPIAKRGDIGKDNLMFFFRKLILLVLDYEAIVKLSDGFNGADMRNVCTEAGMFAIRAERDYVQEDDFSKAVRKVAESKKLESKFDYKAQGSS